MEHENRIVVLIDMDCFYCQVEEKLNPELKGKPIAVVQYNPWKGGGIIAVNYVARAMGVTRHMRGDEAKEKCPEIQLPSVPCLRGKADISKYRDAGKDVAKVLQRFTSLLERASIDEAYLDITAPVHERLKTLNIHTVTTEMIPNTFALGYESIEEFMADVHNCGSDSIDFEYEHAKQLLVGALIVSEIRAAVYEDTGYRCSAGIAHNKILAKLVCGMNKPNKQTVLPKHSVNILYRTLPVKKVKHLGGKFGDIVCDRLKIKTMAELQNFPEKELQTRFDEKNGSWLYNIARGVDLEPVQARFNPKSIGCCKQLRGKSALLDLDSLKKWLKDLGDEIEDRLEKDALENNRTPKQMVVSFSMQLSDGRDTSSSRSYNFIPDDELCGDLFSNKALELVMDSMEGCKPTDDVNRKLRAPIKFLGISVGKFEDNVESRKTRKINDYFGPGSSKEVFSKPNENTKQKNKEQIKNKSDKEYVLRKFFEQSTDNKQNDKIVERSHFKANVSNKEKVLESTLDKQESFFAKFLSGCTNEKQSMEQTSTSTENDLDKNRSTTPICNVKVSGDDSNDTSYSGSTINEEINKSIALFEEDPEEVARVRNMRQLLITSNENRYESNTEDCEPSVKVSKGPVSAEPQTSEAPVIETIECSECGKTISLDMFDVHADYHLALKLREEERQEVRREIKERTVLKDERTNKEVKKKKQAPDEIGAKSEAVASIANFFTKYDNSIPTKICTECGKKVTIEKYSEHLDFHEAQKLSRELNNKSNNNTVGNSSNVKRKRKSASPIKKPKVPCKPINLFFR